MATVFDRIAENEHAFSKTERTIYEDFRKFSKHFAATPLQELARNFDYSQASLTRFAQKLGFSGFQEFQFALQHDLAESGGEVKISKADQFGKYLKQVEDGISPEQINSLAKKLLHADTVYLAGAAGSAFPVQRLRSHLRMMGKHTDEFNNENLFEYLTQMQSQDVVMIFSVYHGTYRDSLKMLEKLESKKPYLVLVTYSDRHPLRSYFDEIVVIPTNKSARGRDLSTSEAFGYFMFVSILIDALMEEDR